MHSTSQPRRHTILGMVLAVLLSTGMAPIATNHSQASEHPPPLTEQQLEQAYRQYLEKRPPNDIARDPGSRIREWRLWDPNVRAIGGWFHYTHGAGRRTDGQPNANHGYSRQRPSYIINMAVVLDIEFTTATAGTMAIHWSDGTEWFDERVRFSLKHTVTPETPCWTDDTGAALAQELVAGRIMNFAGSTIHAYDTAYYNWTPRRQLYENTGRMGYITGLLIDQDNHLEINEELVRRGVAKPRRAGRYEYLYKPAHERQKPQVPPSRRGPPVGGIGMPAGYFDYTMDPKQCY